MERSDDTTDGQAGKRGQRRELQNQRPGSSRTGQEPVPAPQGNDDTQDGRQYRAPLTREQRRENHRRGRAARRYRDKDPQRPDETDDQYQARIEQRLAGWAARREERDALAPDQQRDNRLRAQAAKYYRDKNPQRPDETDDQYQARIEQRLAGWAARREERDALTLEQRREKARENRLNAQARSEFRIDCPQLPGETDDHYKERIEDMVKARATRRQERTALTSSYPYPPQPERTRQPEALAAARRQPPPSGRPDERARLRPANSTPGPGSYNPGAPPQPRPEYAPAHRQPQMTGPQPPRFEPFRDPFRAAAGEHEQPQPGPSSYAYPPQPGRTRQPEPLAAVHRQHSQQHQPLPSLEELFPARAWRAGMPGRPSGNTDQRGDASIREQQQASRSNARRLDPPVQAMLPTTEQWAADRRQRDGQNHDQWER
jgi:hypothetical protein